MLKKVSLATKILLIIVTLTLSLLFVTIVTFYIGGKRYITAEGKKTLEFYSKVINNSLEEEIKNSTIELTGLTNQITVENNFRLDKLNGEQKQIIRNYLLSYPFKYSEIFFFREKQKQILSVVPVKVFSGDIKISFKIQKISQLSKEVQKFLGNSELINNNVLIPGKNFTNQFLYLLVGNNKPNNTYIVALLRYDYLFNKFIKHFALPNNITLTFLNRDGNIFYSTDKQLINQNVKISIPEASKHFFGFIKQNSDEFYPFGKGTILFTKLDNLGLTILLQNDLTFQRKALNRLTGYALLFSLLVFLVVFGLTKMFTHKLEISLNQITEVTAKVGRGDLEQKINIKRDDEIGLLINTFNEMVVKLKKNYEALNITNKELEEKIEELIETKNELSKKEKLAIIGETVSKISHEIQNKISGISIWVQNLEYQLNQDETSKVYMDEIKTALNSFLEMLMNFKKFYRSPALELEEFDINKLLLNVLSNFSSEIKSKKISLIQNFDTALPKINADKKQIEEVLINLLINSIFYSPEESPLQLNTSMENGFVKIQIVDYGTGIDLKIREKIFQPFFTTKADGSGLGLAIVQNIVLAHNGKINVCNKTNAGACFEIYLPVLRK